jgi:hypothetical protein
MFWDLGMQRSKVGKCVGGIWKEQVLYLMQELVEMMLCTNGTYLLQELVRKQCGDIFMYCTVFRTVSSDTISLGENAL